MHLVPVKGVLSTKNVGNKSDPKQNTDRNEHDSLEERFIRITNLPGEISELGLLRLFQFDQLPDKRIMEKCHVVSLKKMDGLSEKVVGVISVPECLKKKVLDYNGNVVDKAKIKVYRTKFYSEVRWSCKTTHLELPKFVTFRKYFLNIDL